MQVGNDSHAASDSSSMFVITSVRKLAKVFALDVNKGPTNDLQQILMHPKKCQVLSDYG